MAFPLNAKKFSMALDTSDVLDFIIGFNSFLQANEEIVSFTLVLSDEAIADGIILMNSAGRAPSILNLTQIKFWLTVNAGNQEDAKFMEGVDYALTVTITTNSNPSRTLQRTVIVTVRQQ